MTLTAAQIDSSNIVPVVAIIAGGSIGFVAVLLGILYSMSSRKQLEQSRREIAAYIAEGSMTPEEGERLMNAGSEEIKRCSRN